MDTTTRAHLPSAVERSTIRKISIRLVPFVALMFFINYLDRTAIGFAAPNGMESDLGLTAAQYGFASGVFFIGYILLEVPSNLALARVGARRWLARIMVSWGLVAFFFTFAQNFWQLTGLRFLLGVAEAGFFPGAILFLSLWVPSRHRSKILALFYLAQPLTSVIGAPLAGLLLQNNGVFGLEGWRFMFLCTSIPAIIVGIIAWFYLKDRPSMAKWLSNEERDWLENELETEKVGTETSATGIGGKGVGLGRVMRSGRVWMLAFIYFGFIYGLYALAFFLPTIIDGFQEQFGTTFGLFEQGVITAIPYLPAAVALYFWSRHATKHGLKTWHIAIPAVVGGVSIPIALYMNSPAATIAVIAITAMAIFAALPNFWTLPTQFLTGTAAAAGVALINTMGNLAGFLAPYITGAVTDATGGSYKLAMFIVGFFMIVSAILMILLGRKRQRGVVTGDTVATALSAPSRRPASSGSAS